MSRWNLLMIDGRSASPDGAEGLVSEWAIRLTRTGSGAPEFSLQQRFADQVTVRDLENCAAVLWIAPGDQDSLGPVANTLLNQIEERALPLIAIGVKPSQTGLWHHTGAMLLPAETEPQTIVHTLRGMLHRQHDFRQLRQELSIARRFHGGLEGEISKMHDELQLAAIVQRELLPREIPSLHGVRFATLWRPANYVSGDIFDLVRLDEDHLGVFVADAVGHGVPAALMTMVISRSLITKEITGNAYRIIPPAEVLDRLNQELIARQEKNTRFATAVYAVINCRSRVMTLAGAGHPPPILLGKKGEPRQLETNGGLLGVFEDETYDQIELELELDDRVIFFSDGFEQAFPDDSADEYARQLPTLQYRDEFEELARKTEPEQMIDYLRQRLDMQRGSLHQIDDLTMVCMLAGSLDLSVPDQAPMNLSDRIPS